MKKVCNIITYLAALAFVLALSSVDSALDKGSFTPFLVMLITGGWIVGFALCEEDERRLREGR